MARFVGLAIAPIYMKQRTKEWSGVNKRKRLFAIMSSSCLAYGLMLLKDKANR